MLHYRYISIVCLQYGTIGRVPLFALWHYRKSSIVCLQCGTIAIVASMLLFLLLLLLLQCATIAIAASATLDV